MTVVNETQRNNFRTYLINETEKYERILNTNLERIEIDNNLKATIFLEGYAIEVSDVEYHKTHNTVVSVSSIVLSAVAQ